MSEADRVFARMTTPGTHPTSEDKQLLHIAPRRRGTSAGQGRVVEVVHRRSDRVAATAEPAKLPAPSAHAATWPEGFQARPTPAPPPVDPLTPAPPPDPQVGHVMPGWEPLLAPLHPNEPPAKAPTGPRHPPKVVKPARSADQPQSPRRVFADPFAADDTGANCIRCGYLVSPARERRGLMTCNQCG
jgi:hypothetical protein